MTNQRLRGVIAAIATPITAQGELDAARFKRLASDLLENGCDGLNVLGTTGEATSFPLSRRIGLMRHAASSGLPLGRMLVGTGAAAMQDAVDLTKEAAELGFAGALVLPPFYYKGVPEEGVIRYIERIAEGTAATPIPIYLYNFPAQSGIAYTVDLVSRLVENFGDRIAGLKDSSGDLAYARAVAAISPELDVFPSSEAVLAEARQGTFAGCISATANLNAELCARAFHQADDDALDAAKKIRALFDGKPLVSGVKAILAKRHDDPGLAAVLPPLMPWDEEMTKAVYADYQRLSA
ncbi:4-hydroxy-tetrahydrodipicolinate synthase [Mesorhizobium sp. J18]|uniref:dihydrodipicolinate synthase family protein n=1 Tax=Mesorhizobium sp. J18 TaxID=935263 RepID=UPI0011991866|nr:dihydrodipicolinate synthase family protein [Mesorhizobium sp. J18]TWG92921.1 4-hydroxy-tetrahydrodipicolinate synthase [Mesorhizobium sp. J18]